MDSPPRAALREFALKNIGTHDLMRTFAEHDGWVVPAAVLVELLDVEAFENVTMYGSETALPAGEVWLFTDHEAALRAQQAGASLGACEGGLWGGDLFATWQPEWGVVQVNPGSPREETLTLQPEGTDLLTMWSSVVQLESVFASNPRVDDDEVHEALLAFQDYIVLIDVSTNEPTHFMDRTYERAMVVCTAPDNVAEFLDVFSGKRGEFRTISVPAPKLFQIVQAFRMDAIAFNQYASRPGWICPASILEHLG